MCVCVCIRACVSVFMLLIFWMGHNFAASRHQHDKYINV